MKIALSWPRRYGLVFVPSHQYAMAPAMRISRSVSSPISRATAIRASSRCAYSRSQNWRTPAADRFRLSSQLRCGGRGMSRIHSETGLLDTPSLVAISF